MPKRKPVGLSNEECAIGALRYDQLNTQKKAIEKELKEVRVPIEDYLRATGVETPNGSKVCVIPYADKEVTLKHTLRQSAVLLADAEKVLVENGFEDCVETTTIVREDRIESLAKAGKIPAEILEKIYAPRDSYAFSVSVKNRDYETDE